jgi:hypothetical protein
MILLKLTIICLVNVLIIDISGFIESVKSLISKLLTNKQIDTINFSLKPFDCSFCMTFWTGLIYTIVIGQFTLVNLLIILLLAFMTEPFYRILLLIKDMILKLIDKIDGII